MMKKTLKSLLCAILCLALLMPATRIISSGKAPLSVFVTADWHNRPQSMLVPIQENNNLPGDPLYRHTNSQGQLTYECGAIYDEMLKIFEASDSQFMLIAGDLTDDGYLQEHLTLAARLKSFEQRTGKQIFVINGNHDIRGSVSEKSINLEQFKNIYSDFGYSQALDVDGQSASYTAELAGDYRLIAVDSCEEHGKDTGALSAQRLAWVKTQADRARADGKRLVCIFHHSLLEHFKNEIVAAGNLLIKDYRNVASSFADWGIQYVFTGHMHATDITSAVSGNGNKIYDIETSCLISSPNHYRRVTFTGDATKIETFGISRIDTGLLPEGYTPQQLSLIQNDFPAYSRGYFKAGMNKFINDYMGSPGSIARALGIEKGTPEYLALAAVMNNFGAALNLPLYDVGHTAAVDSVEEIAAIAGKTLEASGYRHLPELVGTVLLVHYGGDEKMVFDSPEIRLFTSAFKAALVYSLVNIPDNLFKTLLQSQGLTVPPGEPAGGSYTAAAKLLYAGKAVDYFFAAVLKPLILGFIEDSYSPGDLNETFEPYGQTGEPGSHPAPVNDLAFIADVLRRILTDFFEAMRLLVIFS